MIKLFSLIYCEVLKEPQNLAQKRVKRGFIKNVVTSHLLLNDLHRDHPASSAHTNCLIVLLNNSVTARASDYSAFTLLCEEAYSTSSASFSKRFLQLLTARLRSAARCPERGAHDKDFKTSVN